MSVHPADGAVWGALHGTDAARAALSEAAMLRRILEVEAALARVQARLGLIPEASAREIGEAATTLDPDLPALARDTRRTGYPVVGLLRQLDARAGPEAARWTHWGATTQDVLDTALVLALREALGPVREDLAATASALAARASAHRDTVMAGRTHLQHALPTTFGLKCALWARPLGELSRRLDELRPRLLVVQLGGAVGTLASLGEDGVAVMEGLAAELGLGVPAAPWHADRLALAELACWCGLLCGALSKFATDTVLLGQTEVAELAEPHEEGRGGSSTMPQKRNPIAAEYVLAQSRAVHALVPQMLAAMASDHERGTGPWQAEPLALPGAVLMTAGALAHARALAEGMVPDPARMRRNLDATGGAVMAEAAMMALAPALGRGAAHDAVHAACDAAREGGTTLAEALAARPEVADRLGPGDLARVTDPTRYLGSAGAFLDRVLAELP